VNGAFSQDGSVTEQVQTLSLPNRTSPVWQAWLSFLRAYKTTTESVSQDLIDAGYPSLVEYSVLYWLHGAEKQRVRQVDLAKGVMISKGRVTRVLDALVKDGLVRRVPSQVDKRVTYAVLTPKGRRLFEKVTPTFVDSFNRNFARKIEDARYDEFRELLRPLGQ
jgi:DNA-binding MarR family transcriptional regulator